ncbi:Mitogen-activated protein kinase kinase kinase [Trema orientale]|uniref:non-specific serine/threonine protein kinase n=1 Tax=Trema orientale TaxID=63057 RepID=A0A2P5FF64_TREOI|nr:Mitogen-activated protein kinase kinase kinase [Trema orientale]
MEETRDDAGPAEQGPSNASWWPSDFIEKFGSASLGPQEETLSNTDSPRSSDQDALSSQKASQILWRTGMLSEPIPNGFYSVIPEKSLRETFDDIPTLDELHALRGEGFKADIILVDAAKDKKLSMLKQLIMALVKGLNSNPAAMIKKIAGLVSDVYKRPNSESPAKAALEETSHMFENRGLQLLGQIKHGTCRPRAILFKVLADTGLPSDGDVEYSDSYKHMSVIVELNSVEYLVDLMRFPGQLMRRSTKAIFMSHISAAGESDSAENDSCDSPLEPNSPLYGFPERVDPDSVEKDENLQMQRRLESNVPGLSLRNMMLRSTTSIDRKLSLSHSEPNIATSFWRRSRRKVIAEQRTASSSPEHPSLRARGRSMLSGDRKSFREYADDMSTSRSDGASTSEARRIRRRSISITPEIGDDIVRAVRAMNETLKQNRLLRERSEDGSFTHPSDDRNSSSDLLKNDQIGSQKAMSLPSSPHDYRSQNSERGGHSGYVVNDELVSTWNKVLQSSMFNNKPLLPYQEWNIDFSELTVGTRVGIGFFGEVFRGIWNGTDVAIKVFLEQDLTAENMEDFCNEISILSRLRHPNVILFLGACTKPPRLSMVTEYMEMGSLYYLIHLSGQKKKLSWRRKLKMLRDICRGLMCIHRMKIVHRDLKSANCLVNKHWTVKICDFGLSRIMTETPMKDSSSAGTPEWMAPELIRNEPFSEKCDIFSLGVIMWELCTLNRPWEGVPPERVVYAVANEGSRLEIPEGPLGRLISDCWGEPDQRPSCEEILTRLLDCEYALC